MCVLLLLLLRSTILYCCHLPYCYYYYEYVFFFFLSYRRHARIRRQMRWDEKRLWQSFVSWCKKKKKENSIMKGIWVGRRFACCQVGNTQCVFSSFWLPELPLFPFFFFLPFITFLSHSIWRITHCAQNHCWRAHSFSSFRPIYISLHKVAKV